MDIIVGIGEWACSNNEADTIKTFALSSCVAVTAYCALTKASGLIHILLPSPYSDKDVRTRPGYFATTGIPLLINHMQNKYGCRKEDLVIQLYGGAESTAYDTFQIGSRNVEQVYSTLHSLNLRPRRAEIGGYVSRTLEFSVNTGEITIRTFPLIS